MSNYSIQAKSKIQKENPFRLFYEGLPTAYSHFFIGIQDFDDDS